MLESIRLYKDLHDFELQGPTRVVEWIGDKSICVAGYDSAKRNEILQLLIPQKLHAKENPGLCPERDLKVEHGGFIDEPVYSLKHIPQSSLIVTSGPASCPLWVWQIGPEDRDVIQPISTLPSDAGKGTWTRIATTTSASPQILHGSQADSIRLTDIESTKQIHTLGVSGSDGVSTLCFLDSRTVFVCCMNGRQFIADIRMPGAASEGRVGEEGLSCVTWCSAVHPSKEDVCSTVASVSSEGHMCLTDPRNLSVPLKCATWCTPIPAASEQFLSICWAPALSDCISVSGFGGSVQIFDTKRWDSAMKEREAVFIHKGHSVMGTCEDGREPTVTAHAWHPWKERTVLSAASDGSLHVWNWSDLPVHDGTEL
uniref:Integrator complex assembly factor WDR73 n=1 Tax=Xenopus laevis TaxID=8355 RepID=WDR73_XENLA|nr:RecName: Full=WD repeat-containing protein 73 [Xenopus laevis]